MTDYLEVFVVYTREIDDWGTDQGTATPGFPVLVTTSRAAAEQVALGVSGQWGAAPFLVGTVDPASMTWAQVQDIHEALNDDEGAKP